MTLLELAISIPILVVAVSMLSSTLVTMYEQRTTNRENRAAWRTAQTILERMHNEELSEVLALYNADPLDDPGGPNTAPGDTFDVTGLRVLANSVSGACGRVRFLDLDAAPPGEAPDWQLREDLVDDVLGGPRDLNGDNVIDELDHSDDYVLLPVQVEVEWQGRFGPRRLAMYTLLTRMRSD